MLVTNASESLQESLRRRNVAAFALHRFDYDCRDFIRRCRCLEQTFFYPVQSALTSAALPIARTRIKREREHDLRHDLWEMRDAIDRYKDAADRGAFQVKLGTEGYPPDLETLVKGVDVGGKKVRFLRKIPVDPITGKDDWGKRCMKDDPESQSWCGDNVFDVYTQSTATGLDGTKYSDW